MEGAYELRWKSGSRTVLADAGALGSRNSVFQERKKNVSRTEFSDRICISVFCDITSDAAGDLAETAAACVVDLLCGDRSGGGRGRTLALEREMFRAGNRQQFVCWRNNRNS